MRTRTLVGSLLFVGFTLGEVLAPSAEEVRPAPNTPLILNLLARPPEKPEALFQESLRDPIPSARSAPEWEALPDGSYRYGSASLHVIIKNPCPEGTSHAPRPLPGRGRR